MIFKPGDLCRIVGEDCPIPIHQYPYDPDKLDTIGEFAENDIVLYIKDDETWNRLFANEPEQGCSAVLWHEKVVSVATCYLKKFKG